LHGEVKVLFNLFVFLFVCLLVCLFVGCLSLFVVHLIFYFCMRVIFSRARH
jgi:hypothetical protein